MGKRKEFRVKVNGHTYRPSIATDMRPRAIVSDAPRGGGYDNPRITFTMVRDDRPDASWDHVPVSITFQRHTVPSDNPTLDREAARGGWTDTRRRWSECYAGRFEIRVELDVGHKLSIDTKTRVLEAISVAIGREGDERNLGHVTTCELDRTVRALEYLGIHCERTYDTGRGLVPLREIEERGANARAEDAERRARDEREAKERAEVVYQAGDGEVRS